MAYEPKPGDIIRYDFLWKEEERQGRTDGAKDRPCAIVITSNPAEDGSRRVLLAPITHTPPAISDKEKGIEIPAKVSRHLGLDDDRSWVKTHQINEVKWKKIKFLLVLYQQKKATGHMGDCLTGLANRFMRKFDNERNHVLWKK